MYCYCCFFKFIEIGQFSEITIKPGLLTVNILEILSAKLVKINQLINAYKNFEVAEIMKLLLGPVKTSSRKTSPGNSQKKNLTKR